MPIWEGTDAHALTEHVGLGDALQHRVQFGNHPPRVFGFLGEREGTGLLAQQWIVELQRSNKVRATNISLSAASRD